MARDLRARRSTTGWCATRRCTPRRASSPRATSAAGRTRCSTVRSCGSSTGRTPPSRACYAAQSLLRRAAARRVEAFAPVPFVWSDQYGVKIQCAGRFGPSDDLEITHGELDDRQFVALFGRHDRLVGALAFSRPRQLMQYRRMIAERATLRRRARSRPRRGLSAGVRDVGGPRARTGLASAAPHAPAGARDLRGRRVLPRARHAAPGRAALRRGQPQRGERRGRDRGRRVLGRRDPAAPARRPAR